MERLKVLLVLADQNSAEASRALQVRFVVLAFNTDFRSQVNQKGAALLE